MINHELGWRPRLRPVDEQAPALTNSVVPATIFYAVDLDTTSPVVGKRLYYPNTGVLWEVQGVFGSFGEQYYQVVAVDRLPGIGIAMGSVWSAKAERFVEV